LKVQVFSHAPHCYHAMLSPTGNLSLFPSRVPDVSPTLMTYSFCDSTHLEMVLQRIGSGSRAGHCQRYYIPAQRHSLAVGVFARGMASADRGLASDPSSAARVPQYACLSALQGNAIISHRTLPQQRMVYAYPHQQHSLSRTTAIAW